MARNGPGANRFNQSGQDHSANAIPFHLHRSTVTLHLDGIVQKATANPAHDRPATAGARALRDTAATFPDAQADMATVDDLDKMHIGLAGEKRIGFHRGAKSRHVDR